MSKKFSQFAEGDIPRTTDIVVGLRNNINTQFDFSGINDQYGNKIVEWNVYNNLGRNYIGFTNSPAGVAVAIEAEGVDADVSLTVASKANGDLNLTSPNAGDVNIIIGGSGNINMTTNMGKVIINETTGIDAILDEDDMSSNSATAVPTQQSARAFVLSQISDLSSKTFVTSTDETDTLPDSFPLSNLAPGYIVSDGDGVLVGRQLEGVENQINITNIDGYTGNSIFSLSETLMLPGSMALGGDLNLSTYKITSALGSPISLIPGQDADGIDLASSIVWIDTDLRHSGEQDNKFTFGAASQTHYIGGSSIYDINQSGFRLGTGYRVSSISNDAAAYLDTHLMTAYAIQTAIGNAIIGSNNFRGAWDASAGLFPTTGGSGSGGAVSAGNQWRISVGGTLGGEPVDPGDQIIAAVNVPGQTASNWIIVNPRVFSVFGRFGSVVAESGDYSYNQISGLPSTATSGKLMRGTGSTWAETTATYPNTIATNDLLVGGSTNIISALSTQASSIFSTNSSGILQWKTLGLGEVAMGSNSSGINAGTITGGTGTQASVTDTNISINLTVPVVPANGGTGLTSVGISGNILTSNGTAWESSPPASKSYGVFVPFLANKIISGTDWTSIVLSTDTGRAMAASSGNIFTYHYFVYLKVGITYRFSCSFFKFNNAGIVQFSLKSEDLATTYNTLANLDLYSATQGVVAIHKDTVIFSPAGYSAGEWVSCVLEFSCSTKRASSSGYYVVSNDGNTGFSFYEKYS